MAQWFLLPSYRHPVTGSITDLCIVHRSQCSQKRKQPNEKTGQRERRKREREKIKKTEQTVRWRAEGKTTGKLNHLNLQITHTSTTHTHRADCCCCKSDKRRVRIRVFVLEKVCLKRHHQSQMTPACCNTRDVYLSVCVVCACVGTGKMRRMESALWC